MLVIFGEKEHGINTSDNASVNWSAYDTSYYDVIGSSKNSLQELRKSQLASKSQIGQNPLSE